MVNLTISEDQIRWAKSYPFDVPGYSYLFSLDGVKELVYESGRMDALSIGERIPVLAFGSNAAPSQLARKFGSLLRPGDSIPVIKGVLYDYDVVYTPVIVSYGSIPATVTPCLGSAVQVFITYLNQEQLAVMHKTENVGVLYDYVDFSHARTDFPTDLSNGLHAYVSLKGVFELPEGAVALTAVECRGRTFSCKDQVQILETVMRKLHPNMALDAFIAQIIQDADFRNETNVRVLECFG